jgi:hypothetical protein
MKAMGKARRPNRQMKKHTKPPPTTKMTAESHKRISLQILLIVFVLTIDANDA